MSNGKPKSYSLIGAGRLASVLGPALSKIGLSCEAVINRSLKPAELLVERIGSGEARSLKSSRSIPGRLIIITVTDDALTSVTATLAHTDTDWTGRIVLHTSGVHSSEVLSALQGHGAETASFHPLQTFTTQATEDESSSIFKDLPVTIEGAEDARAVAEDIARRFGATPFHIRTDAKILYHAASVTASNYLVTLSALAEELYKATEPLDEANPRGETEHGMFKALAHQAITNAYTQGPGNALTGPVVRGDVDVLAAHLTEIEKRAPHLIPAYAVMATETVRLAVRSERLSADSASAMLDLLAGYLNDYVRTSGVT